MFLKNKNIIFKIRRSKVTDYAALTIAMTGITVVSETMIRFSTLKHFWVKKVVLVTRDDAD